MSVLDRADHDITTEAAKIPYTVFDAGVGKDFDEVYVSGLKTPDGLFACDGAALIHEDWCDDTILDRINRSDHRKVDREWWSQTVHTRRTNLVDGYPQVTLRPFYDITITAAGGSTDWRSDNEEAIVVLDNHRNVRALIGGMASPYSPKALATNRAGVVHLMGMYSRMVPDMHPHHAALAALLAVDERAGAPAKQFFPAVGSIS